MEYINKKPYWKKAGDYFTFETYPDVNQFQFSFDSKEKCRATKGHIIDLNYTSVYPFLFHQEELQVIIDFMKIPIHPKKFSMKNVYQGTNAEKEILTRLQLPFYKKRFDPKAKVNSLFYLFYKMRQGIYVKIKKNKLLCFIPFFNQQYKNDWDKELIPMQSNKEWFLTRMEKTGFVNTRIQNISRWESFGCLLFNWNMRFFSDRYVPILIDMFQTLCKERKIPDCEFFLNKTDLPMLKKDLSQPNPFVYKQNSMNKYKYDSYVPILSCSTSSEYADINIPSFDDWLRVTKKYIMCENIYVHEPIEKDFHKKIPKVVFRGATTGCESTSYFTPRIHVASLQKPYLDAGITRIIPQDIITKDGKIYNLYELFPDLQLKDPIPLHEQAKYKYILDIEGFSSAYRLGYLFKTNSVLFKVKSPWKLYFEYDIQNEKEWIEIEREFQNLDHVYHECESNPSKCLTILKNMNQYYYKYLTYEATLDYLQLLCYHLAFS